MAVQREFKIPQSVCRDPLVVLAQAYQRDGFFVDLVQGYNNDQKPAKLDFQYSVGATDKSLSDMRRTSLFELERAVWSANDARQQQRGSGPAVTNFTIASVLGYFAADSDVTTKCQIQVERKLVNDFKLTLSTQGVGSADLDYRLTKTQQSTMVQQCVNREAERAIPIADYFGVGAFVFGALAVFDVYNSLSLRKKFKNSCASVLIHDGNIDLIAPKGDASQSTPQPA